VLFSLTPPILINELLNVHVASSHSDHQFRVQDFAIYLFRPQGIVAPAESLGWKLNTRKCLGKELIYFVTCNWLIEDYVL
jgi:hypothetical protein